MISRRPHRKKQANNTKYGREQEKKGWGDKKMLATLCKHYKLVNRTVAKTTKIHFLFKKGVATKPQ